MTSQKRDQLGLDGALAVVFGAGPGIGGETVRLLAEAGCSVVAVDISAEVADRAVQEHETGQGRVVGAQADVTSRDSVKRVLSGVTERFGAPGIVINVIGLGAAGAFDEVADEQWDATMRINLRQQFVVAQESLRVMSRPGSYVVVSSINGIVSSPFNTAYGAAKAGLISMVRSLAAENAADGIRVNAVAPGITATPRLAQAFEATGRGQEFAASVPMGRVGDPREIAGAILFLASPLASYVTGQALLVDGGASVKYPIALP